MSEVGAEFFMPVSLKRQAASHKLQVKAKSRVDVGGFLRLAAAPSIAREAVAALEAPGANDLQPVDIGQVAGERGVGRSQAHDALGSLV